MRSETKTTGEIKNKNKMNRQTKNQNIMNQTNFTRWYKTFCLLMLGLVSTFYSFGQVAMTRSTFTGTYVPILGTSAATAVADNGNFAATIPFTFNYLGVGYTSCNINSNGYINFGTAVASNTNSTLFTSTTPQGVVAPWFDDMFPTSVQFTTTGSPGSQVFTVQWVGPSYWTGVTSRIVSYQVKLYETTDIIEFYYETPTGALSAASTSESASIGIENLVGGPGNFIDAVSGSSQIGNGTLNSGQWPTLNYRFTPGAPTAIAAGTYNVGVAQTYTTLTEAVADINHRGISGAITLNLTDATYTDKVAGGAETYPIVFATVTGSSAVNTITITGNGADLRYAGSVAGSWNNGSASGTMFGTAAEPILGVCGTDFLTVNNIKLTALTAVVFASNTGTPTRVDRGLAVQNSGAVNGATFNNFTGITITLDRTNTSTMAIDQGTSTTPTSAAGANSNNVYKNLTIRNTQKGISLGGNATFPDLACEIGTTSCTAFNSIGDPAVANDIGNATTASYGILVTNQSGVKIYNNSIRNVTVNGSVAADGISVATFQGTSEVYNNKIQTIRNISTSATTALTGIRASHTTTGTHTLRIYNNAVSEILSSYTGLASATRTIKGIFVASSGGGTTTQSYQVHNNSVSIDGSASPNISSVCYEHGTSTGPVFNLANNNFANFTAAQGATAKHSCIVSTSATVFGPAGTSSNNNNFFIANDLGTSGFMGIGNTTTYNTAALWAAAMSPAGMEAASVEVNPLYVSNTSDLHIAASGLNGAGQAPPAYVTVDLDCATRTPDNDIGAYIISGCVAAVGGTASFTGGASACVGSTKSMSSAGASPAAAGLTYQWEVSLTGGGVGFANVVGGTGATTTSYNTGVLTAGTYFYRLNVTCSNGPVTGFSNEITLTVNAAPTVTVSPTSGSICSPGGSPVTLTAGGAVTYAWSPTAGLTPTTGSPVDANPAATTTYTVTGTDANGCTNTATAVITVTSIPQNITASATPANICAGASSTLAASNGVGGTFNVGTETATIGGSNGNPYRSGNGTGNQIKTQMLYTAAELTAAGMTAGPITDLGFTCTSSTGTIVNFEIRIGSSAATLLTTTFETSSTTLVFTQASFTPVAGINMHTFNAGTFTWDGISNILVQTCQTNSITGTSTVSAYTPATTSNCSMQGTTTSCSSLTGTTVATKPIIRFITTPLAVSYLWQPGGLVGSPQVVSPASTTIYTVTASNAGCTATSTVAVNITPLSCAAITASSPICAGSNFTLSSNATGGGQPYSYLWSTSATTANLTQNLAAGTYTYTVTVTDACSPNASCTSSITVTVNGLPSVAVSPTAGLICSPGGAAITLTASGAVSYAWSPVAGLTPSTGSPVSANPTATTTYTVSGTDGNGCSASATSVITVSPAVTGATAAATPATLCTGGNTNLTSSGVVAGAYTMNGNSGVAFIDISGTGTSVGTLADDSEHNITIPSFTFNGTAYTTARVGNNGAIVFGSASGEITHLNVALPSTANTAGNVFLAPYWDDLDVQLSATCVTQTVGNLFIIQYTNSSHDAFITGSITFQVQLNLTTGAIHFVYSDVIFGDVLYDAGVNATIGIQYSSSSATQYSNLTASLVDGQSISFTPPVLSYSWSGPSSFGSTMQNPTISGVAAANAGAYTVTITSAAGCTATASANLTVNPLPTPSITGTLTFCSNSSTTLDAGTFASYLWSTGATTQTASVSTAGTFTVTVTDANGCTASTSATTTVNTAPTAVITGNTPFCVGNSITLDAGSFASYLWSTAATTQTISVNASGIFTVTVTDGNGCTGTASVTTTANPLPTPSISGALAFCAGGSTTLDAGAYASYLWSTAATTQTISVNIAGTFTVTVTDANGCTGASASVTATIDAAPTATAGADISGCVCCATVFTVTGSIGGSATTANWTSNGGGTFSNGGVWTGTGETYTPAGSDLVGAFPKNITVTLTTNANGSCPAAVSTLTITLNQVPDLVTTPAVLCNGGSVNLSTTVTDANSTTGTLAYYATLLDAQNETNAIGATVSAAGTYHIRKNTSTSPVCTDIESVAVSATTLAATSSITNVICFGDSNGAIDVTVTPGTAPYTFVWSDGAITTEDRTGLAFGLYTVTVTDANGCTFVLSNQAVGGPPSAVTATCSATDVSCFGGSDGTASVTAGGGGAPTYTYLWSTSATTSSISGLAPGTYTVTVTDGSGCTATCTSVVGTPTAVTASCGATPVSCFGGSDGTASVTAGGGTPGYTYLWNTSATTSSIVGLSAGSYTVTVTDANGCIGSCTSVVSEPSALTLATSHQDVNCFGESNGTVTATAGGGAGAYAYVWTTGAITSTVTGLAIGTYQVFVTDYNGCSITGTAEIGSAAQLIASISGVVNVTCNGGNNGSATVGATGGHVPYDFYLWTGGQTTATATGLTAGTYTATVTDHNGCTATAVATITEALAVTASCSSTNVSCNGGANGQATVIGGGGTQLPTSSTVTYLMNDASLTTAGFNIGCGPGTQAYAQSLTGPDYGFTWLDGLSPAATITNIDLETSFYLNCNLPAPRVVNLNTLFAGLAPVTGTQCSGCASPIAVNNGNLNAGIPNYIKGGSNTIKYVINFVNFEGIIANPAWSSTDNIYARLHVTSTTPGGGGYNYLWSNGSTNATVTGLAAGTYTVTVTDANGCTATCLSIVTEPSVIAIPGSITNVSLFGGNDGAIDITAAGGTPGYSYLWSNASSSEDISTLTAGTYTVTVTDGNGCTKTASFNVTQPAALTVTGIVTNISCNGLSNGSIDLSVTGGVSPYTFLWNDAVTTEDRSALATGVYTVVVTDASSGTGTASFTITEPSLLVASSLQGAAILCNGGTTTVTITASGGTPPYTNDGVQTVSAGAYSITVSDANGCTVVVSGNISEPTLLTASAVEGTILCNGGTTTVTITASGGTPPYTNDGPHTVSAGAYSFTVTDANGCTVVVNGNISQPALLTASAVEGTILCNGGTTTVTITAAGGTSPYTNEGPHTVSAGAYSFTVTDANGCTVVVSGNISEPTVLTASAVEGTILCNGGTTTVTITALGGTPPYTNDGPHTVSAGAYSFTVSDANGCTVVVSGNISEPSLLTASAVDGSILCNGGTTTVTITASGGTSPYTNDGPHTVSAGPYSFTVTDANGCTVVVSGNISEPILLTASAVEGSILCNGGTTTVTITATGGTSPYTNDGPHTVSAGLYSFTVTDANGCTVVVSGNISEPTLLTASAVEGTILCNGGTTTVTITATGGISPYTNDGPHTVSAGPYSFTVTDANGCTVVVSGNISEPTIVTAILSSQVDVLCFGGSTGSVVIAGAGGTGPYTVTPAQTGLAAGTYTFTVTDANGCTATVSATIATINNPLSAIGPISGSIAVCKGSTLTYFVAPVTNATNYNWTVGVGATIMSGAGTNSITVFFSPSAISDNVTVSANNGCYTSATSTLAYAISNAVPAKPASMTGSLIANCRLSGVPYSCPPVAGATSYLWTVPAGVKIVSGQGTTAIVVNYTPAFTTSGLITVASVNACGMSAALKRFTYARLNSPTSIIGPNVMCPGATISYSVLPVAGAINYTWTKVSGSTILSGQGTTNVAIKWGSVGGIIKCTANNICTSSIAANLSVSLTCPKDLANGFDLTDINLYPNPASTSATLQFDAFSEGKGLVTVFDLVGHQVLNKPIGILSGDNQFVLDLNSFPKGIYNVRVEYNGMVRNQKLVVQ